MILWLIFGLMTAAAMVAVLLPVLRDGAEARSDNDIAVYRDQLDELERDLAAGSIGKTEAEAARVEISRRLLAASDAARAAPENFEFRDSGAIPPPHRCYCSFVAASRGWWTLPSIRLTRTCLRACGRAARGLVQPAEFGRGLDCEG